MSTFSSELEGLGWHPFFAERFVTHAAEGLAPARVAVQHRGAYVVYAESGELVAELAGRLRGDHVRRDAGKLGFAPRTAAGLPAIGDWVAIRARADEGRATIHAVLPRRTAFSRKDAGQGTEEQVLAANVDTVFVASAISIERDVADPANLQRLERFLTMAHESGACPVVLLTKADLRADARAHSAPLAALGVDVVLTSAVTGEGLEALAPYLAPGRTAALLGSSGVGKSTLINALLGDDRLATREVRRDGIGRHTTVARELMRIPGRGLIIDTPGLRELQLWDADEGLGGAFADIEELAASCRFRDCRHAVEPGCAVRAAIDAGTLDPSRLASRERLQRELAFLDGKQNARAVAERRHQYRVLARAMRRSPKR